MAQPSTTQILRDSARGGQTYRASRHKLAAIILADPNLSLDTISPFLAQRFFKIDKRDWGVLGFGNKDWPVLDNLLDNKSSAVDGVYLTLIGEYILANADRVRRMYRISSEISAAVIKDNAGLIAKSLEQFDEADWQSLFSFRVYAAQRSHSNELLVDYFKKQMSTNWLRKRFLYPFVYYAINNTPDFFIDNFLSYVISGGVKNRSERETIKFLLCDEITTSHAACFKYFAALLCHPFDACEILLNHFEIEYARNGGLSVQEEALLGRLSAALGSDRVSSTLGMVRRDPLPFVTTPTGVTRNRR
jgi:hypothetical protein